jgi:uncharacterized Zn finger protein
MKYEDTESGDWFYPAKHFRMMCCDCGLVHEMTFRVEHGRDIAVKVSRNDRATAAARRKKKEIA